MNSKQNHSVRAASVQVSILIVSAAICAIALAASFKGAPSEPAASKVDHSLSPRAVCDPELSLADRVAYQYAIEEVYWRHRIWPNENGRPKPLLDEMASPAQMQEKVERALRQSNLLAEEGRPITRDQLQTEMERMASHTKQSDVLSELFSVLNNDPRLIAECLVRPILSDRLIRNLDSQDQKSTAQVDDRTKSNLQTGLSAEGEIKYDYRLPDVIFSSASCAGDSWVPTSTVGAPSARARHTAVWTGSEMIVFGGESNFVAVNTGGRYNPSTDSWSPTATTNAPSVREYNPAVWTGGEMIVWAGGELTDNTGGRYNPITDSWVATSTSNAPSGRGYHTAVWTGNEMIVWGGAGSGNPPFLNTGGRYNPSTDSWEATSTIGAPAARIYQTAVWTGSEMIVWGGGGPAVGNSGGRYNPNTNSWVTTTTTNAPVRRQLHTAIWTGNEMIVWGGYFDTTILNDGGRYDPSTNSWIATAITNAPIIVAHTVVWTGGEMIVWGGEDSNNFNVNIGGRYSPFTDSWVATSTTGAPIGRELHSAIWTGSEMIVWGGETFAQEFQYNDTGGSYCLQGPFPTPPPSPTPAASPTPTPTPAPTPTPLPCGDCTPTPAPTPAPSPVCTLTEGYNNITTLVPNGWSMQNNSRPGPGTTGWFQGITATFLSQSGNGNSYIAANYENGTGTSTLSNWLLTPPVSISTGAQLSFWTRTLTSVSFPDRLQVRMSTNGTSTDVGSSATSVGDFTTLLLDINPTYTTNGYPTFWSNYAVNISGIASPVMGRFAFRYFVENGGPNGLNSDYIGIDSVQYQNLAPCAPTPPSPTPTPSPGPTANGKIIFAESVLTTGPPPTPTPFEDGTQIFQMDSNGANVQHLTSVDSTHPNRFSPKWSFDGNKFLYIEADRNLGGPPFFLYYIIANGLRISIGEPSGGAGWSPDGTKIVFSEFGQLYVVNQDGSNRTNLNRNGSHPAWSSDGTKIAFDISGGIWAINADGSNPVSITSNQDSEPAWSPNGAKIAFVSSRDGNPEVYVMNANGSNQTRLTINSNYEDSPSWSPDGTQLVFASQRTGDYSGQIYTMNADGSNQSRITNNTHSDIQPNWQWRGVTIPTPTPTPSVSISGNVSYCANPTFVSVPNVTLNLTGSSSASTLSDSNGNYGFSSLAAGGSYTVTPAKPGLPSASAGINTTDVIAIQRHYLGVTLLSGCRLTAADVNGDTNVTTVDVIAVQRFFLGLSAGLANVGKYQFTPTNRNYPGLSGDQIGQNYDTLIFGDVASPFVVP